MLLWVGTVLLVGLGVAESCQPQYVLPGLVRGTFCAS